MTLTRLLTAAAALAISAGAAAAQTPVTPPSATAPKPPAQAALTAQGEASPPALANKVVAKGDIIETAKASGQFTTFLKAVDATNLTSVLKTNKNLTVFVPTDAAFAALPAGELNRLMLDKVRLQKLLTHHVVNARVESTKIKNARGPVTTVAGDQLILDGSGDVLLAGNADIVQSDVIATNGVIHVVDKVIMPGASAAASAASSGAAASTTAAQPAETPVKPDAASQPAAKTEPAKK